VARCGFPPNLRLTVRLLVCVAVPGDDWGVPSRVSEVQGKVLMNPETVSIIQQWILPFVMISVRVGVETSHHPDYG